MMKDAVNNVDVIVIGAGPSGSVSSALLHKKGYRVLVLEKEHFPRFSIGESLLPQSMEFLEEADMLRAVEGAGFQYKNGAAFSRADLYESFDFREKFSEGYSTTLQVQRDRFDKVLADESERHGVEIRYGQKVTEFVHQQDSVKLVVETEAGETYEVKARFVLDASGFGRVLPRLLKLDRPSEFEPRTSVFTHVEDNITNDRYDRTKILIAVHPDHQEVWYWLIPFSNGRASLGVVAPRTMIAEMDGTAEEILRDLIMQAGFLSEVLCDAEFDTLVRMIDGYACDVARLYGDRFALLGNAGEFLDPVFSSGVTIALKSASLASDVVNNELNGLQPDWEKEYSDPLKLGVDTFRTFVAGWYDGTLQDVIFSNNKNGEVKAMISSILAGYAWDTENPYVRDPARLGVLAELCQE